MEKVATADLCDAHMDAIADGVVRVLPPAFQGYGRLRQFAGPVSTVKVFEDNELVREAVKEAGEGRVLVVDGGGSLRSALLGSKLAGRAQKNGWAGVVVNGCIRDVDEINACDFGVFALASVPLRSTKRGEGLRDVAISIGSVRIAPGHWCYADDDGIVISNSKCTSFDPAHFDV